MDTLIYKGLLCRLGTYRAKGENRPALFCLDSSDGKNVEEAGFEEVHMGGPWVRLLTDNEYDKIVSLLAENTNQ